MSTVSFGQNKAVIANDFKEILFEWYLCHNKIRRSIRHLSIRNQSICENTFPLSIDFIESLNSTIKEAVRQDRCYEPSKKDVIRLAAQVLAPTSACHRSNRLPK